MKRRIHVHAILPGETTLDPNQARHARDVLRLQDGTEVEVFDDAGTVAAGVLVLHGRDVKVRIESISESQSSGPGFQWTIAAAVPKGERADWMVEKLSELGTAEFIPLATARAVVLPEGKNKRERWVRIATEAAKQSRRAGVMHIGELTRVEDVLTRNSGPASWYFSTADDARPIPYLGFQISESTRITAFIGPEGGWTDEELARFAAAGCTAVSLTHTVLRVETAAIAAATVLGALIARSGKSPA